MEGSIKKWEDIADGEGEDLGDENCSLCQLFHEHDCKGCPVSTFTCMEGCVKTPYEEWSFHQRTHWDSGTYEKKVRCPKCKEIALREVEFLKSLRSKF